jgi:hypothetical protein
MNDNLGATWQVWVDRGYAAQMLDYPVTRAAADARVAEMRASHPTWKFAVLQSRQTPMPGDFT